MKEIKCRQQTTNTFYQCGVCKKEHYSALEATNCEKSHTCKHEPVFEFIEISDDAWWFNTSGISSTCKFCKTELGEVTFEGIEDNQLLMETIFELIKKHNQ